MAKKSKIAQIKNLAETIAILRAKGKKVVLCHGLYETVHAGHIMHFEAAKNLGDILAVTLTQDKDIKRGRPIFDESLRAKCLSSIECIDFVAVNSLPSVADAIRAIRPDFFITGSEGIENGDPRVPEDERRALAEIGGEIHYAEEIKFSSSELTNYHWKIHSPEVAEWLGDFKSRNSYQDVIQCLSACSELNVLVIGDAIIDEYLFCQSLGISTKDPILATRYLSLEKHAGGSLAVANHVAGICPSVGLVCCLGQENREEGFIRSQLRDNVEAYFVTRSASPTIHKRRFVDMHTQARLLELYIMKDEPVECRDEVALIDQLEAVVCNYDLVIVTDYGHGMMSRSVIDRICSSKPFLAVNTQANAGNRGFNTISKYSRADYVCLAGHEIEIETRMRHSEITDLIAEVEKKIDCKSFTVTVGKDGSIHHDVGGDFTKVPAFAGFVADRVGAGDALFAVAACLKYNRAPADIVGFIGNVAGAYMVTDLGNRKSISFKALSENIKAILE